MREELAKGAGLLVRFEDMYDPSFSDQVDALEQGVMDVFGTDSTIHLYHATQQGSRALQPHTDPYDVLVLQLQGSKVWTTCVPDAYTQEEGSEEGEEAGEGGEEVGKDKGHADQPKQRQQQQHPELFTRPVDRNIKEADAIKQFSDAQLGQLQEIRRQTQQGCTSYTDENLRGMKCSTFTLNEGDTLYLPKGIIHYAIAQEGGSSHITISLERKGLAWADALLYGGLEAAHIIDTYEFQQRWQTAVSTVISDHRGVPYLEALPSWLTTGGQEHSDMCAAVADVHGDANLAAEAASSGGGIGDDARAFVETYGEMCRNMEPLLWGAYAQAQDLDGLFHHAEVRGIVDRVCSEEVALAVLSTLCTEQRLPHDVTARTARAAAGNEVCSGG